ncbi:MAG: dipeptidase PepE [Candidatus Sericytochromatia bacterium]
MNRLLLISNSTQYGEGFLEHCAKEIIDFLGKDIKTVLFIPYASGDLDNYSIKVRHKFTELGYRLDSIHDFENKIEAIKNTDAIFTGGGNTFRLLKKLYEFKLIEHIVEKIRSGTPYIGTSAGSNIACPTIKTTNDMPITYPPSFDSLNLVPFNINPHYIDIHPEQHMGETRQQRIKEFHELNDQIVVGLREGTMLRIENNTVILKGINNVTILRKDGSIDDFHPNSKLDFLLKT